MADRTLRALDERDEAERDLALKLAGSLIEFDGRLSEAQVQTLYDTLLTDEDIDPDGVQVVALGYAFGALFAATDAYEWQRLSDEYGEETCVAKVGRDISCAPISMMQKRIQRRETVNIAQLREATIEAIDKAIAEGEVEER